jgi:probable phosphoglycerate mutase
MSKTVLLATRHGQTIWNKKGRLQGHLDSPLSPLGRTQAEALALRLSATPFTQLYTSDLGRTVVTAEPITEKTGRKLVTDASLRERAFGAFEGLTVKECKQRFPDAWRRFKDPDPDSPILGGETLRERHERVCAGLQALVTRHRGETIVVVGHGGTLDSLFRMCTGLALEVPRTFSIRNASLCRVDVQSGRFCLVSWGDTKHLDSLGQS